MVTFNTDAPESRRMCFVGQDSLTAGRVAGALMGEEEPRRKRRWEKTMKLANVEGRLKSAKARNKSLRGGEGTVRRV